MSLITWVYGRVNSQQQQQHVGLQASLVDALTWWVCTCPDLTRLYRHLAWWNSAAEKYKTAWPDRVVRVTRQPDLMGLQGCFEGAATDSRPVHLSHSAASMDREWYTLRASLSGTLLQTLPDLVTQLKGYSLSPRSCPPTRSAPSESFGY